MKKAVIADSQEFIRIALASLARETGRFETVDRVGDAQAAVNACSRLLPDMLVLEIEMPGRDPLAAVADVRAVSPGTRVVILTAGCSGTLVHQALRLGVCGYLLKSDTADEILRGLSRVLSGGTAFSRRVLEHMRESACDTAALDRLTPRELEVLRYIGQGRSNDQMAGSMSLSKRTVERHVSRLMSTLGIRDRAALQRVAARNGVAA
jgi:DNA-binding NarL/FixJ family response regulator